MEATTIMAKITSTITLKTIMNIPEGIQVNLEMEQGI